MDCFPRVEGVFCDGCGGGLVWDRHHDQYFCRECGCVVFECGVWVVDVDVDVDVDVED